MKGQYRCEYFFLIFEKVYHESFFDAIKKGAQKLIYHWKKIYLATFLQSIDILEELTKRATRGQWSRILNGARWFLSSMIYGHKSRFLKPKTSFWEYLCFFLSSRSSEFTGTDRRKLLFRAKEVNVTRSVGLSKSSPSISQIINCSIWSKVAKTVRNNV